MPLGGSLNYIYSWTSDPPGFTSNQQFPVAYPSVNTTYYVEVTDGYNAVLDSVIVAVKPLPARPDQPSGPDTVDLNYFTISQFTITGAPDAEYYKWELLPDSEPAPRGRNPGPRHHRAALPARRA